MKFLFIIGVTVLISAAHAQVNNLEDENNGPDRIFNGKPAAAAQFPHQVALYIYPYSGPTRFCGGSLISRRWVLTAAHCIQGVQRVSVVMGVRNLTNYGSAEGFVQAEAENLVVYPGYFQFTLRNDIALIKLDRNVQFTKEIQPISLPSRGEIVNPGESLTVSGWGRTDAPTISPVLNYAEVQSISNADCKKAFNWLVVTKSVVCCVGKSKESTCQGDSGGPLVGNVNGMKTLVGVISFGSEQGCTLGKPQGYTRVEPYLNWIRSVTNLYL